MQASSDDGVAVAVAVDAVDDPGRKGSNVEGYVSVGDCAGDLGNWQQKVKD